VSGATLKLFLEPVQRWFQAALGQPTPAQERGWPAIAAGQHTLILAPTGSGKTLAAFLACLDQLWRQESLSPGVRVLYVSPLKALNNDIHRNLQAPLEGVAEVARQMGLTLPHIESAVRTGDTPAGERQRLIRQPPHVLITTPESLHLLLTSRARETLRGVTHCIVDEIHALCANKRGVFLALLLERLQALNPAGFVRIGLSATQRPLDEVARYLGGQEATVEGGLRPRPVTIIDAGLRKDLDLRVLSPVEHFGPLPEKSVWPSIYRLLGEEIGRHRSTIVFVNNRRAAERITAQLNEAVGREEGTGNREEGTAEAASAVPSSLPTAYCLLPTALAHHGSIALEARRQTEEALKEGRLPAVVATASLELGIDMGAVDLVCQVESPGSVSRGLQRVGRAGHLVGQTSKGRLIAKTAGDLLEQAVLAREMAAGRVELIRVPVNCLDVLAQQIVAMTAVEAWNVPELYALVRRAYPYRDLAPQAFESVLKMVSGRYRFGEPGCVSSPSSPGAEVTRLTALQPRLSWDRVHNRLHALPGSKHLALVHGGTIPDTGQYGVYTTNGARIGELDEEFIYERRVGDVFLLGTNAWRLEQIDTDRVLVSPAAGAPALVPFWHGEQSGRSYDLGRALGAFLRELAGRLDQPDVPDWLQREFFLDAAAARDLRLHVRRQQERTGCLPTDRTLFLEACRDPLGDWQIILLSPLGSKLHLALRLALEGLLRRRLGYRPQCVHHADGILVRLADTEKPVLDLLAGLTAENVESLVLEELADSPLFAVRFRQNAARALLLPGGGAGKRAPLWLQRLRGRDLLQAARRHPDFPLVAETFRECLHDHLDLPRLQQLLADLAAGQVEIVTRRLETPSPFASALLFAFNGAYQYQLDGVEREAGSPSPLDRQLLDQLLAPERHGHLLDPRAVHHVERRLRGLGRPPRSAVEMAEWLRRLGDLTEADLEGPMAGFLAELEADGRVHRLDLLGAAPRWVLFEDEELYLRAFGLMDSEPDEQRLAASTILDRFLTTHALVGLSDVLARYPFEPGWARRQLEMWAESGRVVAVQIAETEPLQWSAPDNLEQIQRGTLGLLRREVITCPGPQFADFVLRWQGLHPEVNQGTADGVAAALHRLEGVLLPAELWEQAVLPGRVPGYQPRWLDECLAGGEWTWVCRGEGDKGPGLLAFLRREQLGRMRPPVSWDRLPACPSADRVLECLRARGALFVTELSPHTGLVPSVTRSALWELLRRGIVTNDRFDVIRRGEEQAEAVGNGVSRPGLARRRSLRNPEGRWSLLPWEQPDTEMQAVHAAGLLLERFGIVARELALLDPWMPPWRVLYEVLSRMELAGTVRRGYFVEELSGAQFALPEAAQQLQDLALPAATAAPLVLVHGLDPANLYGAGAPFDIPLLDGGTRPLLRRGGTWLVLRAGRPVLLVEQRGRRLTALASASAEEVAAAVALLPDLLQRDRTLAARRRLTVSEWNGQPVSASEGRTLLEAAGFVRDYQDLTLYAAWR
jgi:ATP-dependent Lhr-like helicase